MMTRAVHGGHGVAPSLHAEKKQAQRAYETSGERWINR
jgi:hypothetical protein